VKQFYSCIDALLPAPQPEQHELSKRKADKEGGHIVFYGAEEYRAVAYQPFILPKLVRTPGIDGVIFFSIDQFCYGKKFNLKLMKDIISLGLSIHFAREDLSFTSFEEITTEFITLSAYFHSFARRRNKNTRVIIP
jgi:hypothetical protein